MDNDQNNYRDPIDYNDEGIPSEDDQEYDALNDETFGADIADDWEESHEKLAEMAEMSRQRHDENGEVGYKMASFILDDDGSDFEYELGEITQSRAVEDTSGADLRQFTSEWLENIRQQSENGRQQIETPFSSAFLPPIKNVCTVEEIERNLRKTPSVNGVNNNLISGSVRLEDLERELKTSSISSHPPSLLALHQGLRPPMTPVQMPNMTVPPGHAGPPRFMHHVTCPMFNQGYAGGPIMQPMIPSLPNGSLRLSGSQIPQMPPGVPIPPVPPGVPMPLGGPMPHGGAMPRGNPMPRGIQMQCGRQMTPGGQMPHMQPGGQMPQLSPGGQMRQMLPGSGQMPPGGHMLPGGMIHRREACPNFGVYGPMDDPPNQHARGFWHRSRQHDEYAGLMTQQEKNWLAQIQQLQLNTSQPFQDDYYFAMTMHRQCGNGGRKLNGPGTRSAREFIKSAYTPLQFENSLGKLQVGSVTAPRKIIDMDVVESVECRQAASSRKVKQILLEIEHMYTGIMSVEESQNPLIGPQKDELEIKIIINSITAQLLIGNKLQSVMAIRKGRMLVLRLLPNVKYPGPIVERIISSMALLSRKDTDQILLRFLPFIRTFLCTASLSTLNDLASTMETQMPYVLTNKFTISVIANMIERAETIISSWNEAEEKKWLAFVARLTKSSTIESKPLERPVVGIDSNALHRILSRCPNVDSKQVALLMKALSILNTNG